MGNQDDLSYFKQLLNLNTTEHVILYVLRAKGHLFKFQ